MRRDPGDFPTRLTMTAQLDADAGSWGGRFDATSRGVDLGSVRAVYYRRPSDFQLPAGLSQVEQAFARSQARHAFSGVLTSLPGIAWLNHPAAMADARVKPYQLAVAANCGLQVPATLITNDPATVGDFASQVGGRIITKSLATMVTVDDQLGSGVLFTSEVAEDLWTDPGIATTAHLFQERLPGVDIRLTAVGGQLFAAEIRPDDLDGPVDIRAHHESVTYHTVDIPPVIRTATLDLLRRLRLTFAALDFRIVPGRGWIFLEANPNGQWAFIPQLRDLIAEAITDFLETSSR